MADVVLNGHMDPGIEMTGWSVDPHGGHFEDGWIWGMGAHDDKGGVAAMITAVEALIRAGMRPKGDILVCPVIAHKYGGVGTRALLAAGIRSDMCINLEHSANTIANVCVGLLLVRIRTSSPDLFFRYSKEAREQYWNPIEQQCEIIRRLGQSLTFHSRLVLGCLFLPILISPIFRRSRSIAFTRTIIFIRR